MIESFGYYAIAMNLCAFILCAYDKSAARNHHRRISEKTLFLVALLGGAFAFWIGMLLFRHKTKHWYFRWGMPLIAAVQTAGAYIWINKI